MSGHRYRLHGIDVALNVPADMWPRAGAAVHGPTWAIDVETNSAEVARDLTPRRGVIGWEWRDGDVTELDVWGSPPRGDQQKATSLRFTIDYGRRTVQVRHSADDEAGCIDLLSRWVLPDIARTEMNLLPVHASAVETESGAVLVLGASGRGKSTLTAAMLAAGAVLLCDEPVCVGPAGAWPGPSALRLEPHVAREVLGAQGPLDYAGKAQLRADVQGSRARPIAAFVFLSPRRTSGPLVVCERMYGPPALATLMQSRYVRISHRVAEDVPRAVALAASVALLSVSVRDDLGEVVPAARELLDRVSHL